MKIVSTSYSGTPGFSDPQQWLHRISFYTGILEELAKRHEVMSIERIGFEGSIRQNGVDYRFIDIGKKVIRFPWRMHRFIKAFRPDVVLVNGLIFPFQVMQLRLRLGKKVKIILIHRSERPFTGVRKFFQRWAGRFADAYFFTSAEFGDEWVKKGNIGDLSKIYEVMHASSFFHPQSRETARAALKISGSPLFLWVGRLDANKDPLTVLKAFRLFRTKQPAARLYMIYHKEEMLEQVKTIAEGMEQVRLIGKVEHHALQSWYSAADFIISGSHYEGGGIAVTEAMSCGCIPIVTNIISFRRMTGPGKCGILYEPGDEQALFNALLMTTGMDINKESGKTIEQFRKELSFEAIARKIEDVIITLNR